jgi:cytoskeletal protein RodZ
LFEGRNLMINEKRVQRFRNIIYTCIVLAIIVPIILLITLCVRMIGMIGEMETYLDAPPPETSMAERSQPTGQSALAPENQSFSNPPPREPLPTEAATQESTASEPTMQSTAPPLSENTEGTEQITVESPTVPAESETDPIVSAPDAYVQPADNSAVPVPVGSSSSDPTDEDTGSYVNPITGF